MDKVSNDILNKRKESIINGKTSLGIELGSTRIKAVLIDENYEPIASGEYAWENDYIDNYWTYSLDDIWAGLQGSYKDMKNDVKEKYGVTLTTIGSIGFSAMMHGYMAFNKDGELLVPFRTWRNTTTGEASKELMDLFNYNIPLRWSIAHLYQAILNKEEHVSDIDYIATLAAYVHWKLTGKKVLGIGDASGMFPIDYGKNDYNQRMVKQFDDLIADYNFPWKLTEILPKVLVAGEDAGSLTEEGAKLLDPEGDLVAGVPLCPPEGDAGTGMVATNSVAPKTANVSAGTSIFAMIVLEEDLANVHEEIDMVTTPSGEPVAMVHVNNCTSDINAWVSLFAEFADLMGMEVDKGAIFTKLFNKSLEGDKDCGDLMSYNYFSGEPITKLDEGRPLFVRKPDSKFNLANFMRANIYSAFAALNIGLDILYKENVEINSVLGHGGIFKTKGVAQSYLAAAMKTPVSVMETAGEGGAWGIALLANYMLNKQEDESLADYLKNHVFAENSGTEIKPNEEDVAGFERFMDLYKAGLSVEEESVKVIR